MKETEPSILVTLPQELQGQFTGLKKRLWQTETLAGVCFSFAALLISCLLLFASDRVWDTPTAWRATLTASGVGIVTWFAGRWLRLWVFRPRDLRALAVLVQRRYRRLGDRLLGVVELANESQRPAGFSLALYRAAIDQVAAEARQFDFLAAVTTHQARRAALVLVGTGVVAVVLVLLSPAAAQNAFYRWLIPTATIPRFTLVSLEGLPSEQIVAHGEPFEVTGNVRYRSAWRPGRASGQVERQTRVATRTERGLVRFRFPGQVTPGTLVVRLGDARQAIQIRPMHRPSLKELRASVDLPAYLQYPLAQEDLVSGVFTAVEGSKASLAGTVSRSLKGAQMRVGDQNALPLAVKQDSFTSEVIELDGVAEVAFSWQDEHGLTNAAPWPLQVRLEKDSPAIPELKELLKDTAILDTEVLDLKAAARDDFGVREIGIDWQLLTGELAASNTGPQRLSLSAPAPRERTLEETFPFSPAVLGIPLDSIVEVRAFATDFFPGREPSQTPVFRVHVLGTERHAELVRQNLESLLSQLEEVTRLEEKLTASTHELQQLTDDKLDADQATERIAAAKEEQNQNAANLEQLAKEGKMTLREAFRNPTFSEETLREWTKNMQEMQQLSQNQMQQASQSLESAQQKAEARRENLQAAAQKEQEILDALEQMQRNVNKGLDELQALTLAQRLRKVAADEQKLAARLKRIIPEVIGMLPHELPARFKQTEANLATDQESAQKETAELHGEIGRFFERTQKETYGDVHKRMEESKINDELERVRGLIQENISMDAMQNLVSWADRLNGWADLLEPPSGSSGAAGEGSGEGQGDEALMKVLLGLLRVRDREINVRQRTGLVERQRLQAANYAESAKALAETQVKVREGMSAVQGENPVPALEFPLQDIVDSMQGVEELLNRPQTDRATDLAETKAIAQLSDVINLINEQQQKGSGASQSQSATAEEMAFLMEMMAQKTAEAQGMATNPQGGGSTAGGTTDRASLPTLGDPNAKVGDGRSIERASGAGTSAPTEFREALDDYYRALEQLEAK